MSIDLNSPEVKAAIEAAVEEKTAPLLAKRDELLSEVKKLRKQSEIKPEDYQSALDQIDELQSKLNEANKSVKAANAAAEKATKALEAETGYTSNLLIDNGLNEHLGQVGVKPEFMPAVRAMLRSQVQIKQDGESRNVVIGEKPLKDFVAEWAKSNEGKHFVAAPMNGGGGSSGGGKANGGGKQITRTEFESMGQAQRFEFTRAGGTVTE